jgi:O-antigen ligase
VTITDDARAPSLRSPPIDKRDGSSTSRTPLRWRATDIPVTTAFLAIPLAVSPVLGDQFTAVKWYVLELLAIVWVVGEALARRGVPWPDFLKRHAGAVIALVVLTIANSLRTGLSWAVEPLLARATFVALAWCAFSYFERNGVETPAVRWGLTTALAVVIAIGLAQVLGVTRALGWEPLLGLTTGDGRSATFGNANMAAQFVGLALTLVVAHTAGRAPRTTRPWLGVLLMAAALTYLYLLGSRSALLGLAAGFAMVAVLTRRSGLPPLFRVMAIALVAAAAVAFASAGGGLAAAKAESVTLRLHVWQRTLALVVAHPLGVGSGNFVHAFLPYQLADERLRSEDVVYTHPHNELLRALAEEGILWVALASYLSLRLIAAVRARARREGWPGAGLLLAAGAAFLGVECTFQFPFSMAFGSLSAAFLLGLALSFVQGASEAATARSSHGTAFRVAAVAATLVATVAWGRLVLSDGLTIDAPHRACALNPRNLRACLASAWLQMRDGDRNEARVRLADLLQRSPYYYPAIKLLAEDSLAQGDPRAGCFHLWVYDRLFGDRSSVHERLVEACPADLLDSFRSAVEVPGYRRFPLTVPAGGR